MQGPPPETTGRIVTAHDWVVRLGRDMGDSIWPRFRPDTIPVVYVVRGQGTLLLGWRGDLPERFLPIAGLAGAGWQSSADRGAASTGTELAGRPTAQVVVNDSQDVASLVGLTTHEAFHVFATSARQEGSRFGRGENSFLVTSYPVFDPQNEAGVALSIRLRYYATGPALGLLLDALEGPSWKTRLMNQNLTMQDALADASGYRTQELALRRQAESTFVMARLRTSADSGVAGLRAFRRAQVDSVLAAPGVELVVTVEGRYLGLCGIDPQNLLQVEPGVLLHTRWVQACAGDVFQATFNTPVVQDRNAQVLRAVVGADSTVKVTVGAQGDLRIESPLVLLRATKADVSRDGRVLTIKIKP